MIDGRLAVEAASQGDDGVEVADLAYDSREVGPGSAVFLRARRARDGHEFAPDAVARGAVALVVERRARPAPCPRCVVADVRAAMAPLAVRFWGDPSAELALAGITGTNGKTTTAFLLRGILEAAGTADRAARAPSSGSSAGREEEVERTTPEAIDLQRDLAPHARRRATRLRDGGLLARARLRPRRRDRASTSRCSPT